MKWEPILEEDIWDKINEACLRMNPAQGHLWDAIKIIPEKWRQSPYGDAGGGFWAVAVIGRFVIWFNDIEDGFNCSSYSKYGIIDDYWCNQDELEWTVQRVMNVIENGSDGWANAGPPVAIGSVDV
jgi:hypothetical protein